MKSVLSKNAPLEMMPMLFGHHRRSASLLLSVVTDRRYNSSTSRRLSYAAAATTEEKRVKSSRYRGSYRFVDRVRIRAHGGSGGKGCLSYERFGKLKKRPDGGNGGHGGSVFLVADPSEQTLKMSQNHFLAQHGVNGTSRQCHGRNGKNRIVRVPCGVVVRRVLSNDEEWSEEEHSVRKKLQARSVCDDETIDTQDTREEGHDSSSNIRNQAEKKGLSWEHSHWNKGADDEDDLENNQSHLNSYFEDDNDSATHSNDDGDNDVDLDSDTEDHDDDSDYSDDDSDHDDDNDEDNEAAYDRESLKNLNESPAQEYEDIVNKGIKGKDGMYLWRSEESSDGFGDDDDTSSNEPFSERKRVVIADLDKPGSYIMVAAGGWGGTGNYVYAKRQFFPNVMARAAARSRGQSGDIAHLELELKLIADVGLVGFPNAGKSSLLAAMSKATPKIAPYPFTTLHPLVGCIEYRDGLKVRAADVPGLIGGASTGRGRGHDFLRHLERTKALLYMVDAAGVDGRDPVHDLRILLQELLAYGDGDMLKRPAIVVANKLDLISNEEERNSILLNVGIAAEEGGILFDGNVIGISAGVTGEGLGPLSKAIREVVLRSEEANRIAMTNDNHD